MYKYCWYVCSMIFWVMTLQPLLLLLCHAEVGTVQQYNMFVREVEHVISSTPSDLSLMIDIWYTVCMSTHIQS